MKYKKKQQLIRFWTILVLLLVSLSNPSIAAEKIVLVGSEDTKASFTGRWLNLIYTEVFRRLGYELQYDGYPNERAAVMAESGRVDGEIQRAASYEKITKNLLKVEEPSFTVRVAAYAVRPGIALEGWKGLKNTNYAVEYRRGSKLPEKALPAVVKSEKLSTITTVAQGLKKLISGHTDIFIEQEWVIEETFMKSNIDKRSLSSVYQAGIMWTGNSHLYLHKSQAPLLPKISEVLKTMKQEGVVALFKEIAQNPE